MKHILLSILIVTPLLAQLMELEQDAFYKPVSFEVVKEVKCGTHALAEGCYQEGLIQIQNFRSPSLFTLIFYHELGHYLGIKEEYIAWQFARNMMKYRGFNSFDEF